MVKDLVSPNQLPDTPDPWGKLIGAVTNATTNGAAIVTLKKAET